jgi:drug/metabolite transporter (DMT)-like permease
MRSNATTTACLLALAAIWGASFLFMRIAAPVLGPAILIELRVAIAAAFLAGMAAIMRKPLHLRCNWRRYLALGLLNSALPFFLLAYAAQTLPASLLAILNATSPIFGALAGALWLRRPPSAAATAGLALGVAGVAILVGFDAHARASGSRGAVLTALAAALCYGLASVYAKAAGSRTDPFLNAHGSMWAAVLLTAPALPFIRATQAPTLEVSLAVLALGVLCTGIAYLLYFRLIRDLGPTSALTVTFLIPVFGVLWGVLFLDEQVGLHTLAGTLVVLSGTALVTGYRPRPFWRDPARGRVW